MPEVLNFKIQKNRLIPLKMQISWLHSYEISLLCLRLVAGAQVSQVALLHHCDSHRMEHRGPAGQSSLGAYTLDDLGAVILGPHINTQL